MSLRSFLEQMETKEEILHVKDEVSTRFEVPFTLKKFDARAKILFIRGFYRLGLSTGF